MKTIQINIEPPYLIVLMDALRVLTKNFIKNHIGKNDLSDTNTVFICSVAALFVQFKTILKESLPETFKTLYDNEDFKKIDVFLSSFQFINGYEEALKTNDILTDLTKFVPNKNLN